MMSKEREQFQIRVQALLEQIKVWVEPHDWVTRFYPKRMRDESKQLFEVSALYLQKGPMKLLLDPMAYDVPGSEGVIDLYLMPAYDDLATLSFEDGKWMIHYTFPSDNGDPQAAEGESFLPCGPDTIAQVLDSITHHAAPSF